MTGFFFVILGLYVLERLFLLRPGEVAWLLGDGAGRARRLDHQGGWANRFGSLHVLSLLPETRTLIVAEDWPCACSAEALTDGRQGFLKWDEVDEIRTEDLTVLVNQRRAFRRATPASSKQLARFLIELRDTDPALRERQISSEISRRMDPPPASERIEVIAENTRELRRVAGVFAVVWAGVLPALLLVTGIGWFFLASLLVAVLLWLAAVILVWRRLEGPLAERIETVAPLALLAPATVRAAEILARREDYGADPLAVALLPDRPDRKWLRLRYAALRNPLESEMPASQDGRATFERFRALQVAAFETCLRQNEIQPESLGTPPRIDPQARSFCPRCHDGFLEEQAVCNQCQGMATQTFDR